MPRAKPQFERVSVALAKKILAAELKRKEAAERLRDSTNKKLNTPSVAEAMVND
ncbi:MAG: hypothetical protein WAK48_22605 [Candidatus Acidiferrum sp.]